MDQPRLLLAHPYLSSRGGSNAVAAWTVHALRNQWRITLATLGPVDLTAVNESFGTDLRPGDLDIRIAPAKYQNVLKYSPTRGALLNLCLNMRWARELDQSQPFDLLMSTENECDFGRPGLQYVHFPWRTCQGQ